MQWLNSLLLSSSRCLFLCGFQAIYCFDGSVLSVHIVLLAFMFLEQTRLTEYETTISDLRMKVNLVF